MDFWEWVSKIFNILGILFVIAIIPLYNYIRKIKKDCDTNTTDLKITKIERDLEEKSQKEDINRLVADNARLNGRLTEMERNTVITNSQFSDSLNAINNTLVRFESSLNHFEGIIKEVREDLKDQRDNGKYKRVSKK